MVDVAAGPSAHALSEAKRHHILAVLRSEEYCDLAPAQVWALERHPPTLDETAEHDQANPEPSGRVGRDLILVLIGLAAIAAGATALVEGVRHLSGVEETQTRLGLTLVGFATAFELVALAWSATRRGITPAVIAAVVGSFTYNVTMTLGGGALARPLRFTDAQHSTIPGSPRWPPSSPSPGPASNSTSAPGCLAL